MSGLHLSTCSDWAALNVCGSVLFIWPDISNHLSALIDHFWPATKLFSKLDILVVNFHVPVPRIVARRVVVTSVATVDGPVSNYTPGLNRSDIHLLEYSLRWLC
jgi:hypothetical protein